MSERTYEVPDYAIQNMRNRIAALRAQNAELMAALQPFCDAHFYFSDAGKPDDCRTGIGGITYGDFRRAVSALAAAGHKQGSAD